MGQVQGLAVVTDAVGIPVLPHGPAQKAGHRVSDTALQAAFHGPGGQQLARAILANLGLEDRFEVLNVNPFEPLNFGLKAP